MLLTRPEAQILNVSSMGAYALVPGQTAYGATKAAVRLFTEGVRSELAGTNVGATVVFPGATTMYRLIRLAPEWAANLIQKQLASLLK